MTMSYTVRAMVQSSNTIEDIEVIKKVGDNDYIVKTKKNIKCHAIFNCFTGLYYADDVYTIIESED